MVNQIPFVIFDRSRPHPCTTVNRVNLIFFETMQHEPLAKIRQSGQTDLVLSDIEVLVTVSETLMFSHTEFFDYYFNCVAFIPLLEPRN